MHSSLWKTFYPLRLSLKYSYQWFVSQSRYHRTIVIIQLLVLSFYLTDQVDRQLMCRSLVNNLNTYQALYVWLSGHLFFTKDRLTPKFCKCINLSIKILIFRWYSCITNFSHLHDTSFQHFIFSYKSNLIVVFLIFY